MDDQDIHEAIEIVGGALKLSVLAQKRVRELVPGAHPLVRIDGKPNPPDVALQEVLQGKIRLADLDSLNRNPSDLERPNHPTSELPNMGMNSELEWD